MNKANIVEHFLFFHREIYDGSKCMNLKLPICQSLVTVLLPFANIQISPIVEAQRAKNLKGVS